MASPIIFVLLLLLFSITITTTVDSSNTRGFAVELIHRDSPGSPFYDPFVSHSDRLHAAARRSAARANYIRTSMNDSTSLRSDIRPDGGFEYLMAINIGTPPLKMFAIADTGSDLIWVHCGHHKRKGPLVYDPSRSSTYNALPCTSSHCSAHVRTTTCSSPSQQCEYAYSYADETYTKGTLSSEIFTFNSSVGGNYSGRLTAEIAFGCSHHEAVGTLGNLATGLVGLGGGPLSLVSQLSPSIGNKFSYFLAPYHSNGTGTMTFGDNAKLTRSPNVVTSPMAKTRDETFYTLYLDDVTVGDQSFSLISDGRTIMVDSGTTYTFLDEALLRWLVDKLSRAVEYPRVTVTHGHDLCFNVSSLLLDGRRHLWMPEVTFRFRGAAVTLPAENTFVVLDGGRVACLAMRGVDEDGAMAFGNMAQQGWHVEYDVGGRTISFAPGIDGQRTEALPVAGIDHGQRPEALPVPVVGIGGQRTEALPLASGSSRKWLLLFIVIFGILGVRVHFCLLSLSWKKCGCSGSGEENASQV